MLVKINYHGRCFDGLTSASLFQRFYRERVDANASFAYEGLVHRPGNAFPSSVFDGDVNAVVDFRYHKSPKLTWWFDHHTSAFENPDEELHFRADRSGRKYFNPKARSCAKFLAETLAHDHGFDTAPYEDLIYWADIIDGAQFPDAETAVSLREPALRLMTLIEANADKEFEQRILRDLTEHPLDELAAKPELAKLIAPLLESHQRSIEVVRSRATLEDGVVFFDVADLGREGFNKFIPYWLFPQSRYVVAVSHSRTRSKVSVGSNPWSPTERTHNLAKICERFGGGGHPVVAAISMPPADLERARAAAREIVSILRAPE